MKEFRKKINRVMREERMSALLRLDCEERTKDVHMLRVTKDMQAILKGGADRLKAREMELLEKKIEYVSSQTANRVEALKAGYKALLLQARAKRTENDAHASKLHLLTQDVNQREQLKNLQGDAAQAPVGERGKKKKIVGGGGAILEMNATVKSAASERFSEARRRKSMQDRLTTQTEEIQLLRVELNRLRERTFPSFVQVHEEAGAVADQR